MTDGSVRVGSVRMREVVVFSAVGAAAFTVHYAVVASLVPRGVLPLIANVVGFLSAVGVSFVGHARWSFPGAGRELLPTLTRFFFVAGAGFALNESLYALLLAWTALDFRFALVLVLGVVAVATFVASRWLVFVPRRPPPA